MKQETARSILSPTARRLIRSYGLILVLAVAFLLMALLIKEKDKTVPASMPSAPIAVIA